MSAPDSSGYKGYEKCPQGYVYVHPHYQDHTLVKGHCRRLSRKEIKQNRKEKVTAPYLQYDFAPPEDSEIIEMWKEKDSYNPQ